ncbi:MAG TPA: DUF2795 domain-containing protein [Actinocatenispora sp.]
MVEPGNSKHADWRDDALAREDREYVQGGHSSRAESWREEQGSTGPGQPEPEAMPEAEGVGGTPPGMDAADVSGRSDLARLLSPREFPADAVRLADAAARNGGADDLVALLRALPTDRTFRTVTDVWSALGHGTEDDARRF